MKERNFYFGSDKKVLDVLEHRNNPKTLVSYFVARDISTGNIHYIVEVACNARYVTSEYWWNNARHLEIINIESYGI